MLLSIYRTGMLISFEVSLATVFRDVRQRSHPERRRRLMVGLINSLNSNLPTKKNLDKLRGLRDFDLFSSNT